MDVQAENSKATKTVNITKDVRTIRLHTFKPENLSKSLRSRCWRHGPDPNLCLMGCFKRVRSSGKILQTNHVSLWRSERNLTIARRAHHLGADATFVARENVAKHGCIVSIAVFLFYAINCFSPHLMISPMDSMSRETNSSPIVWGADKDSQCFSRPANMNSRLGHCEFEFGTSLDFPNMRPTLS